MSRGHSDGHEHYLEDARQRRGDSVGASFLIKALTVIFIIGLIVYFIGSARESDQSRQRERNDQELKSYLLASVWRTDIDASVSHGPRGVEPPMLEVTDYGDEVTVRNIAASPLECVSVHRSALTSKDTRRQTACSMDYACRSMPMDANFEQTFKLGFFSPKECVTQRLIFQIGGPRYSGPSWISDELLTEFDRNHESIRTGLVARGQLKGPR